MPKAPTRNAADRADGEPPVEGVQSIRRALAILRALAVGGDRGVRLIDATRAAGLNRPTVHRLLRALVEEGLVEQSAETRRYAIGEQLSFLALARTRRSPLLRAAEPHMVRAAAEIGDTVFLTVRTGLDTLCVSRRLGRFPIQVLMIEVGARRPLGVSSAGIAMLTALPPPEVQDVLTRNTERMRLPPYSMSVPRALELVERMRGLGFAVRERGLVPGTKAVSMTIPATPCSPLAALTIAAIRPRLPEQRVRETAEFLRAASGAIVKALRKSTG